MAVFLISPYRHLLRHCSLGAEISRSNEMFSSHIVRTPLTPPTN